MPRKNVAAKRKRHQRMLVLSPRRTFLPADPPANSATGFMRTTIVAELAITSDGVVSYSYSSLHRDMCTQLSINPTGAPNFAVNISKIYVYAIKMGDPRDAPRIAISFRDATKPTAQSLVLEDRGTLERPAKVAALIPPFVAVADPASTDLVFALQGNGAAAPKHLAVTAYFFLKWRASALAPPNKGEVLRLEDVLSTLEISP